MRVTRAQLDAEVAAVTNALGDVCPLHLTLERVVVSRGGVVMACWQVSRGITTKSLRDAIQVRTGSQLTLPWLPRHNGSAQSAHFGHTPGHSAPVCMST